MYIVIPIVVVLGALLAIDVLTDGSRRTPQTR